MLRLSMSSGSIGCHADFGARTYVMVVSLDSKGRRRKKDTVPVPVKVDLQVHVDLR